MRNASTPLARRQTPCYHLGTRRGRTEVSAFLFMRGRIGPILADGGRFFFLDRRRWALPLQLISFEAAHGLHSAWPVLSSIQRAVMTDNRILRSSWKNYLQQHNSFILLGPIALGPYCPRIAIQRFYPLDK